MSKNHDLTLKEKTALAVAMDSKLAEQNGDTTKRFDKINVGSPLRSPTRRWADHETAEDSAKALSETAEANLVKRATGVYNISKEGRELVELKKRMQGIVKLGQSKANGWAVFLSHLNIGRLVVLCTYHRLTCHGHINVNARRREAWNKETRPPIAPGEM